MKLLYMIIATFVQVLLTSFILYTCASPVPPPIVSNEQHLASESRVQPVYQSKVVHQAPAIPIAAPAALTHPEVQRAPASEIHASPREVVKDHSEVKPTVALQQQQQAQLVAKKAVVEHPKSAVATESKKLPIEHPVAIVHESPVVIRESSQSLHSKKHQDPSKLVHAQQSQQPQQILDARSAPIVESPIAKQVVESKPVEARLSHEKKAIAGVVPEVAMSPKLEAKSAIEPTIATVASLAVPPVSAQAVSVAASAVSFAAPAPVPVLFSAPVANSAPTTVVRAPEAPIVKGGQGPLHLLAATLCSYQPDRPTGDEQISNLYAQRASLRKSLFDFMSLKFTNLEKFSSRLHSGLEVMPPKPVESGTDYGSSKALQQPTHGWPVVGKCTAHDLRLMAEAAWCECTDSANCDPVPKGRPSSNQSSPVSTQHNVVAPIAPAGASLSAVQVEQQQQEKLHHMQKRSIGELASLLPVDSPSIVPKLVDSIKSSSNQQQALYSLNLTQQQYSAIQVQAGLTQECKRNALRLSKALFQHLAEDQSQQSESWPKLYAQLQEDECARKRLIDIVTALSGYRTEASSIRRDNVEFAFAMDDLRSKVLESEVTAPLTFDRHFIEVEQFLQQSVKLMLANIDPERAKLTSMRYRSLMPAPMSVDDQCVQLHQLLLAKTHPQECNPNQYGQLPDILRMAANSLALWSIESELSKLGAARNLADVHPISVSGNSNECIANLVSS